MTQANMPQSAAAVDERASLLGTDKRGRVNRPLFARAQASLDRLPIPETRNPKIVVLMITFLLFTLMVGAYFIMLAQTRILEDIVCHHYYDQSTPGRRYIGIWDNIPESLCKGKDIQTELNTIMGVGEFLECVPGVFLAYPYGKLADRWGRKTVFLLCAFGIITTQIWTMAVSWYWRTLPLRLIWIAPIFQVIGGGESVLRCSLFAIISDVSTDETRANNFFLVGTGGLTAQIIAPAIASLMMKKSPWISVFAGVVLLCLGASLILVVPETLHMHSDHGVVTQIVADLPPEAHHNDEGSSRSLVQYFQKKISALAEEFSIFNSKPIVILLVSFLLYPIPTVLSLFLTRYLSRRFGWSLADTGFLLSYKGVINIVLLLVILPTVSRILTIRLPEDSNRRWYHKFDLGMSTKAKDLALARGSLIFLIIGAVMIGSSPTIATAIFAMTLWTLGTGFAAACRSLISTYVDQSHMGRLYAAISLVEIVGQFGAIPLFNLLYAFGLKRQDTSGNDVWLGTPFFGVAVVCLLAGAGVFFLRLPEIKTDVEASEASENAPLFGA